MITVCRHHARLTTYDCQNTTVAVDEDQQDYNVEGDNVPDNVDLLSRRTLEEHSRETDAAHDTGSWDYNCQSTDSACDPRQCHSPQTVPAIHDNATVHRQCQRSTTMPQSTDSACDPRQCHSPQTVPAIHDNATVRRQCLLSTTMPQSADSASDP